ncbi:hypothetical protein [Roseococcus sp. YIM B11640]|uniref:hypothetical protein n=1 Tax=Roseococcus sp. YIM B11640 TaxID=3133973 RepID=UPI003C7E0160
MSSEVDDLFDPAKAPELTGLSVGEVEATAEQLRAAEEKLRSRVAEYGWRRLSDTGFVGSHQFWVDRADRFEDEARRRVGELRGLANAAVRTEATNAARTELNSALDDMTQAAGLAAAIERASAGGGGCYQRPLPFYGDAALLHIAPSAQEPARRIIVVATSSQAQASEPPAAGQIIMVELDGTSPPIHALNKRLQEMGRLSITTDVVEEYVDFFCAHVHGDAGPFAVIEHEERLEGERGALVPVAYDLRPGPIRAQVARPLINLGKGEDESGAYEDVMATIFYSRAIFRALFRVRPHGMVEMREDHPVMDAAVDPVPLPWPGPKRLADGSTYGGTRDEDPANDPK